MPGRTTRILHVDDDPDIREIVNLSLCTLGGFEVRSCQSARQALDIVQDYRPDLALLDLMMPEIDGEQLFQMLRGRDATSNLPVVFVTAQALETTRTRLLALGALDVIFKPFDPLTLPGHVKSLLDSRSDTTA